MSEIVDYYFDQTPEKCRKCPVIGQFIIWANDFDAEAHINSEYLNQLIDSPFSSDSHQEAMSNILSQCTDKELESLSALATLIEHTGDECPGIRRGSARKDDSRTIKTVAFLMGEKACQNPQFAELQDSPVIGRILFTHWDSA